MYVSAARFSAAPPPTHLPSRGQANALFGQVVLSAYKPGDMVWVQDYHLMLLPSILKQTVPRMKVREGGGGVGWRGWQRLHASRL